MCSAADNAEDSESQQDTQSNRPLTAHGGTLPLPATHAQCARALIQSGRRHFPRISHSRLPLDDLTSMSAPADQAAPAATAAPAAAAAPATADAAAAPADGAAPAVSKNEQKRLLKEAGQTHGRADTHEGEIG